MQNPAPSTYEKNVRAIWEKAKAMIEARKREAVQQKDFDRSMTIAANEAKVESHLRKLGII